MPGCCARIVERGLQALVGVGGRHPQVDDRDLGSVLGDGRDQLLGVAGLPDDVEAGLAEQQRDPFAQQHRVVGDHYAHGISALSRVPPAGGLQIFRRPSSASTRSASPRRPEPSFGSAPPLPSSVTSTTSLPFSRRCAISRIGPRRTWRRSSDPRRSGSRRRPRPAGAGARRGRRRARPGPARARRGLQRDRQAVVGQDRGVDAARDVAQLLQRRVQLLAGAGRAAAASRASVGQLAGDDAQDDRERDEPLLGAVVEVALELAAGGVAGLDDAGARGPQVAQAGAQVRLQALVLERDPGRGGDRADELGLLLRATRRGSARPPGRRRVRRTWSRDRPPAARSACRRCRRRPRTRAPSTRARALGSRSARASASRSAPGSAGSEVDQQVAEGSARGGRAAGRRGR